MSVKLERISIEQKDRFLNLYNLYLYDLSQYTGEDPKENGQFDPTNTYLYLERDELHPFFIKYEEQIIGFILVCSPPFVPEGVDYIIQELFLLKKYRGNNLASTSVAEILDRFRGKISISQLEENRPAVRFWKKYYQEHQLQYIEAQESIALNGLEGLHQIITQTIEIPKPDESA